LTPLSIYCLVKNSASIFTLFGDSLFFGTQIEYNAILPSFLMIFCAFVAIGESQNSDGLTWLYWNAFFSVLFMV